MPRVPTMAVLVLRAQQLADMEGDESIGATEWNALVSEAYGEAYEAIAAEGTRYFETTHTYTSDGTNALPQQPDLLSVVDQLELVLDAATGRCRRLQPITSQQRAALSGRTGPPRFYEVVAGTYYLYPTPPSGQKITIRYIQQCPDLTAAEPTDSVDCYCAAGQKFVIYAAAAAAVQKSKNDASALLAERSTQRDLLRDWASDRQMNVLPVWYVEDGEGDGVPQDWAW